MYNKKSYDQCRVTHFSLFPCTAYSKYPLYKKETSIESEVTCCWCLNNIKRVTKNRYFLCGSCKNYIEIDSKFCKHCGEKCKKEL